MIKNFPYLLLISSIEAALPEEYEVTDITGWSAAQLTALPHFDHWVPGAPGGASGDFVPIARNGLGVVAGNRNFNNGAWVQGSGAFVKDGATTSIAAWLRPGSIWSYSWSRTWFDGEDVHFQNGFVTHSPVRDVNALGQIVGYATIPGSGDSGIGYHSHAYLRDAHTGEHVDLTPEAHRADPGAINDLGEITGLWSNDSGSHPFRRSPDGIWSDLTLSAPTTYSMTPTVINNLGHVAGHATVYTVPNRDRRPFFSASGSTTERLPFPGQNSPDAGTIADINNHDILVGEAHKSTASYETNGVRWAKTGGNWEAEDLNELLADHEPEMIIERALAINDAGYLIVSGRLDGTDTPNTKTILLSPDEPAKPTAANISPENIGATSATIRGLINAADSVTTYHFLHGATSSPETTGGSGNCAGTQPVMATHVLGDLTPYTEYFYQISATNPEGTSMSSLRSFTTKYDWPTWAAAKLNGSQNLHGDANANGIPDSIDFLTNSGRVTVGNDEGSIRVTIPRSLVADGATLILQASADLGEWEDVIEFTNGAPLINSSIAGNLIRTSINNENEEISVIPVGDFRYFRLKGLFP